MKFTFVLIFGFGFTLVTYAAHSTSDVASIKKSIACYEAIITYSSALGSSKGEFEKLCAIGQSRNTLWKQRAYDELHYWRNLALPLSEEEKQACEQYWHNAWRDVRLKMTDRINGSRVINSILPGTTENIPDELSTVEAELFFRSAMEQEMTRNSMERGKNSGIPKSACRNPHKAMTLARLENVLYFDQQRVFDKGEADAWPNDINLRLWLVAQHADFFPAFQKRALAYFGMLHSQRAIPGQYIRMLENRISDNATADWYQKFAREEKAMELLEN